MTDRPCMVFWFINSAQNTKAAPEEVGADVGGRRAARLSTRAIQMSARTALLAVLTVRLMPSGSPA